MLQLHPERWTAEHHGSGHTGEMQEGERGDGEEHRRGNVGGGWLQREHMRNDDAAITASNKKHDESRHADAGDEHGLQACDKTGEDGMQERQERGQGSRQRGRGEERNRKVK